MQGTFRQELLSSPGDAAYLADLLFGEETPVMLLMRCRVTRHPERVLRGNARFACELVESRAAKEKIPSARCRPASARLAQANLLIPQYAC